MQKSFKIFVPEDKQLLRTINIPIKSYVLCQSYHTALV